MSFKRFLPKSLTAWMVFLPVTSIFFTFLLLGTVMGYLQYQYLHKDLIYHADLLGEEMTINMEKYLLLNDYGEVELLMHKFAMNDIVTSVTLINNQYTGLIKTYHSTAAKKIKNSYNLPSDNFTFLKNHHSSFYTEDQDSIAFYRHVTCSENGCWLEISVSKDQLYTHLFILMASGGVIVSLFIGMMAVFIAAILRKPLSQIEQLRRFSATLSHSNGEVITLDGGVKEIAEFASNLNELSIKLYDNQHLMDQQNKELKEFNNTLSIRIKEEVEKNREKEIVLLRQSRLAALGEMIGNIAHQWRQPLNSISLATINLQLSKELGEMTEDEIQHMIDEVTKQTAYLSQTIDDFRDLLKPDKETEPFNIGETTQGIVDIYASTLKNFGIAITLEFGDSIIIEHGSSQVFGQVVMTLLSNAKDAFEHISNEISKSISITITDAGEEVQFLCCDNAGGVPEAVIDKIFDPYFTTKHQSKGTGLGLYIAKNIINNEFGGNIEVRNHMDGACFHIVLPKRAQS